MSTAALKIAARSGVASPMSPCEAAAMIADVAKTLAF